MNQHKNNNMIKFKALSKAFFDRSSDKKNTPSTRGLRLESLENRELLSATTWESPAAAAVSDNSAIVLSVQSDMAPISLATLDASVEKIEATPAAVGSNKASIEWTRVESATKYYLMSSTSTDGENFGAWSGLKYVNDPGDASDAQTVATQLTLTAGKYYHFKVRAITPDGTTDYTETEEALVVNKPESPVITSAAVDHSTGIATVEFDTIENASFYRVDYTFDDGATWQFAKYVYVGEGDATSSKIFIDADADSAVVEHKLNANKTYYFRVRATNDCGSSEYTVSDPISYKGAAAPEWVNAEVKDGSHYATITWAASDSATEYFIQSSTNGGESWSGVKKASAEDFTYDAATDSYSYSYFISTGKTYQYRVRAYNELGTDGNSTESNEVKLSVVGDVESFAITNVEAVNPTNYPIGERYSKVTLTLTWDAADNATKYVVKYSKDGGDWKLLKNINDPSVTSVTFGAVAGSYYDFSITAVNSLSHSEEVKTGVYGVYKATLNRVDVVEGETLEATTVAPAGVTTAYQWQSRTAHGDWIDIAGATDSTYTPTGDDVANHYWIRVLVSGADADCPAGSYVAEGVAGPVLGTLDAPSDFSFGDYDSETHKLSMSWVDNSDNEDGFYVEYSADGGQTWAKAAWLDANVTERVGSVYEENVYQFRVRAYNADGYSDWAYSDKFEVVLETPSLVVTTTDDVVNPYDGKISLREAIQYAAEYSSLGNEITFDSSLHDQTITLTKGELEVAQSLTINGGAEDEHWVYVSGDNKSRIFNVTADDVLFQNLSFTNGSANFGGAVYAWGVSSVAFEGCSFEFNSAAAGGAVYMAEVDDVYFHDCAILYNTADSGGAVELYDAGATFDYVYFLGNKATSGSGGAVQMTTECDVNFVDSFFVENESYGEGGGAVYVDGSTATLTNTVFNRNTADAGGAILATDVYTQGTSLTLQHVTIVDNTASWGGGIYLAGVGEPVNVYNSIIYGNSVSGGMGSNVYVEVSQLNASNNLTYSDNGGWWVDDIANVINNDNVVEMADNDSLASIMTTEFEYSEAEELYRLIKGSPAINAGDHNLTPDVTTDVDGKDRDFRPDLGAYEFVDPDAEVPSLCVTIPGDIVDDTDHEISLREAIAYAKQYPELGAVITFADNLVGQTIFLTDGELEVTQSLTIDATGQNITVNGNDASRIFNIAANDFVVEGLTFAHGLNDEGGAVYFDFGASATFNACVFTNNSGYRGGAVYIEGDAEAKFINTVFANNSATWGGAIYATTSEDELILHHVTIVNNAAATAGGGLYLDHMEYVEIKNSIIYGNTTYADGEGMNVFGEYSWVDSDNILTSTANNGWTVISGATFIDGSVDLADNDSLKKVIDPNTFEPVSFSPAINAGSAALTPNVKVDLYGNDRDDLPDLGAVEYTGTDELETPSLVVTIPGDVVANDGQISLREAIAYAKQYPELGAVITFADNLVGQTITLTDGELEIAQSLTIDATGQDITVSGEGASRIFNITARDKEVVVNGLTIANGVADEGGAVYMDRYAWATFNECVFTNNEATEGGAVYAYNADATFVNTVFSGNTCPEGFAIYLYTNDDRSLTLQHVTIVDNDGGICLEDDSYYTGFYQTAYIYNSIIYGNAGYNLYAEFAKIDARNNLTCMSDGGWYLGQNASVTNENVIDLANNTSLEYILDPETFEPVSLSPAINAGDPERTPNVATDLYGNDRDDLPDLGAVEYTGTVDKELPSLVVTIPDDYVSDADHEISLREAIAYAKQYPYLGSTITFADNLVGQVITLGGEELTVDQSLTFNASGQDITVSGEGESSIFNVTSGNVAFKGLTFANAVGSKSGGAFTVIGDVNVTFDDCVFTENYSDTGGAVLIAGAVVATFNDCEFTNNEGGNEGGAIAVFDGATTLINACVFTNNTVDNLGGAVNIGPFCNATITNSVFSGNKASSGGAIYMYGANDVSSLTLQHVTVVDNKALTRGGGLYLRNVGAVNIYNSIIYGNTVDYDDPSNGLNLFSGNSALNANYNLTYATGNGWTIDDAVTNENVINIPDNDSLSLVLNPETFELVGGSKAYNAGLAELTPDVTVDLYGNPRDDQPDLGAIEFQGEMETPTFRVTIAEDIVDPTDGEISLREAVMYVAQNPQFYGMIVFAPSLNGQTITLTKGELEVTHDTIFANSWDLTVSADNNSRIFNISSCKVTVNNLKLTNGSAEEGGVAYIDGDASVNFIRCNFTDNSAVNGGAVFVNDGANTTFTYCVFTDNTGGRGGALIVRGGSHATVTNSVFTGNTALMGGAIHIDDNSSLTLQHVTIVDNTATERGGGLYLMERVSADIYNSIIYGNTAQEGLNVLCWSEDTTINASNNLTNTADGGWVTGDANVTNAYVIDLANNDALAYVLNLETYEPVTGSPAINAGDRALNPVVIHDLYGKSRDDQPDLGAVEHTGTDETETPSLVVTISSDTVADDGEISLREAIAYAKQYPNLGTVITFADNLLGQTIELTDGELEISHDLTINAAGLDITLDANGASRIFKITSGDVTFDGLSLMRGLRDTDDSTSGGGAVLVNSLDANVTFNACDFRGNYAKWGGAVEVAGTSTVSFNSCVFLDNNSESQGGAVVVDAGADVTFDSCFLATNVSQLGGALMIWDGSDVTIVNSVFSENDATVGGAIYAESAASLLLHHATVVANRASLGGGVCVRDVDYLEFYNSIIYGNSASTAANVNIENSAGDVASVLTCFAGGSWNLEFDEDSGRSVSLSNLAWLFDNTSLSSVLDTNTFQLVDGSMAIDAGDPNLTPDVTTDYYGNDRDELPDLGALEYGSTGGANAELDDVFADLADDLDIDWDL